MRETIIRNEIQNTNTKHKNDNKIPNKPRFRAVVAGYIRTLLVFRLISCTLSHSFANLARLDPND